MTTKDWRKTSDGKEHVVFKKRNYNFVVDAISIHKGLLQNGFHVDLLNEPLATRRTFKNKTLALAYAKRYMETH